MDGAVPQRLAQDRAGDLAVCVLVTSKVPTSMTWSACPALQARKGPCAAATGPGGSACQSGRHARCSWGRGPGGTAQAGARAGRMAWYAHGCVWGADRERHRRSVAAATRRHGRACACADHSASRCVSWRVLQVGSCRNSEDEERIASLKGEHGGCLCWEAAVQRICSFLQLGLLKTWPHLCPPTHSPIHPPAHCPTHPPHLTPRAALATELGVASHVDWCVNASFEELRQLLGDAVAGLHTMVDEHFGISVVEYMAAGEQACQRGMHAIHFGGPQRRCRAVCPGIAANHPSRVLPLARHALPLCKLSFDTFVTTSLLTLPRTRVCRCGAHSQRLWRPARGHSCA